MAIYEALVLDQSKFTKTVKRILAEFLLIAIGVTIALWLENLKEREVERTYIESLQSDWATDIARLEKTIA